MYKNKESIMIGKNILNFFIFFYFYNSEKYFIVVARSLFCKYLTMWGGDEGAICGAKGRFLGRKR